ncbi:SWIRM-domain-containing protein [Ceratobasidium sp. AG-I]|nr:SWIRM-domain-containing protein [Ceratobasidium sp. AG-I]
MSSNTVADVGMEEEGAQAKRYLASQTHDIIIPSYSVWFDMGSIHSVEKRALPEFFNSRNRSKTPTVYKDYRDFMLNAYRMRPAEYLTVTACRRNLAGDVCAIMRVHAFLEQWGLINYQVDPETRPSALVPPFTGHFRITVDSARGLQPLHPGPRPPLPAQQSQGQLSASGTAPQPGALELRKSIYMTTPKSTTARALTPTQAAALANTADAQPNLRISYACDTCGADCTALRFHSLTRKNFELCPSCYADARFPSTMLSGDFVRLTADAVGGPATGTGEGAPWTDQETLRLLEAIEAHDDDWGAVADQVGTRTRDQCIQHFLQLPIEDPYLDDGAVALAGRMSEASLGPLRYARIPFDQAENPVMSVVAFLASAVGPGVAAAASGRAIGEMKRQAENAAEKEREKQSQAEPQTDDAAAPKDKEKEGSSPADKTTPAAATTAEDTKPTPAAETKDKPMDVDPTSPVASQTSAAQIAHLASVALSTSAATASHISETSLASIHSLTAQLLQTQMAKLDLKLAAFGKLEDLVAAERDAVRRERRELAKERKDLGKERREVERVGEEVRRAGAEVRRTGEEVRRAREEVREAGRRLAERQAQPQPQPLAPGQPNPVEALPELEMGDFPMNIDMAGMDFSMMGMHEMNVQDVDLSMGGFGEADPSGMHGDGFTNLR